MAFQGQLSVPRVMGMLVLMNQYIPAMSMYESHPPCGTKHQPARGKCTQDSFRKNLKTISLQGTLESVSALNSPKLVRKPIPQGIVALQTKELASVGDTATIPFEYCAKERPSCTLEQSFNLSAPNPECTLAHRHSHCEMTTAPQDHPIRQEFEFDSGCELCELLVHGVTQVDAGQYTICQTCNTCTGPFWRDISVLEIVIEPTPSSTPVHVSTETTTTDAPKITKPTKPTTENSSETNFVVRTDETSGNDSQTGMKLSSSVGIPVTLIILAIVIIVVVVYFYKRQKRREPEHIYYGNGNTPTVHFLDECKSTRIKIDKETTPLEESPDLDECKSTRNKNDKETTPMEECPDSGT